MPAPFTYVLKENVTSLLISPLSLVNHHTLRDIGGEIPDIYSIESYTFSLQDWVYKGAYYMGPSIGWNITNNASIRPWMPIKVVVNVGSVWKK